MKIFAAASINFQNIKVEGDQATITLVVPYASLEHFKTLLESLASFSSFLQLRGRHQLSRSTVNNTASTAERTKYYQELVTAVHSSFDRHFNGSNFRVAVLASRNELIGKGRVITCGMIENIIRSERKK